MGSPSKGASSPTKLPLKKRISARNVASTAKSPAKEPSKRIRRPTIKVQFLAAKKKAKLAKKKRNSKIFNASPKKKNDAESRLSKKEKRNVPDSSPKKKRKSKIFNASPKTKKKNDDVDSEERPKVPYVLLEKIAESPPSKKEEEKRDDSTPKRRSCGSVRKIADSATQRRVSRALVEKLLIVVGGTANERRTKLGEGLEVAPKMRTYAVNRRFACHACDRLFARPDNLYEHMKHFHGPAQGTVREAERKPDPWAQEGEEEAVEVVERKPSSQRGGNPPVPPSSSSSCRSRTEHPCDMCHETFASVQRLTKHMLECYGGKTPYYLTALKFKRQVPSSSATASG